MNTVKVLSIIAFIGIAVLALIAFGCTWKVLGIGIVVSAILSFIYYKVLKKVIIYHDSED